MNGAQLHLALNHFPVVLSVVSLSLLIWSWKGKSADLKKASLLLVIIGTLFSGAAYLSGEPAEDVLKSIGGFEKSLVHEHEEAAEFTLIINCLSGLAAFMALFFSKRNPKLSLRIFVAVVALNLLSCATYLRTAHLGGLIRHEEIRK